MLISTGDINPGKDNLQRKLSQGGARVEVPGSPAQNAAPWRGSLGAFVGVAVCIMESGEWRRVQLRGARLG